MNKEIKMHLKMYRKYWNLIASGDKKYEVRKLSKGLEKGYVQFTDGNTLQWCTECKTHTYDKTLGNCAICNNDKTIWQKQNRYTNYHNAIKLGTAYLRPIGVNIKIAPNLSFYYGGVYKELDNELVTRYGFTPMFSSKMGKIDKETYDFIKENYIDKDIDFVVYEISDVKGEYYE